MDGRIAPPGAQLCQTQTLLPEALGIVRHINGIIIAGIALKKFDIVKDCTIKIFGYNTGTMDDFNPHQLITLCLVFIGFHVIAVPSFLWAMRHRQFSGREQKEWNLESNASPEEPLAPLRAAPLPGKARVMLGILSVLAATMIGSIFLVLYVAFHAHPAPGQPPF